MTNLIDKSSNLPTKKQFAGNLILTSRISYWIHLLLGVASGITLILVALSGNFANGERSILLSSSLIISVCALIAVGIRVYWALRYTRMAKQLQHPDKTLHPRREEVIRALRRGLIVSLTGLVLAFTASEIATIVVVAKAIAQPQGVAIYNPEKIVREMDLFLVFAGVNLMGAHILGSVNSLSLLNWITKE